MNESQKEQIVINGKTPVYHVVMNPEKMGLDQDKADLADMAEEYAIIAEPRADGGLLVYAKYNGKWNVNPWSTRFLIRALLEAIGVNLPIIPTP